MRAREGAALAAQEPLELALRPTLRQADGTRRRFGLVTVIEAQSDEKAGVVHHAVIAPCLSPLTSLEVDSPCRRLWELEVRGPRPAGVLATPVVPSLGPHTATEVRDRIHRILRDLSTARFWPLVWLTRVDGAWDAEMVVKLPGDPARRLWLDLRLADDQTVLALSGRLE